MKYIKDKFSILKHVPNDCETKCIVYVSKKVQMKVKKVLCETL